MYVKFLKNTVFDIKPKDLATSESRPHFETTFPSGGGNVWNHKKEEWFNARQDCCS